MTRANPTATVIVTMAGCGQRFRDAGYDEPKYRLQVRGRSLFDWSQSSLREWSDAGARFLFVTRPGEDAAAFLAEQCPALGITRFESFEVEPTDGQATTALAAAPHLDDPSLPVAIYNIDTYVDPRHMGPRSVRGDGWIPCFPGEGSKWSFARVDGNDRVLELREKERISEHATVGFYWFSSFTLYRRAYDAWFSTGGGANESERYVAPLYNQLLAWDHPCYIDRVPSSAVVALGTPEDLRAFEQLRASP